MSSFEKMKHCLYARMNPENYCNDFLIEEEAKAACQDINECMQFIQNECTDEEFYWLSEIFDDVMGDTESVEFLKCIRERVQRFDDPELKEDIIECIRSAAAYIEE